ncbi:MAG TPA: nitrate ABC transporter ATP-binding protein, partial [Marinilabiliales bacterium]|nr:nitrate ABC transporter ATP-binding protein [Marinilabiliales bacterium]
MKLRTENLIKKYGSRTVVKGVSVEVEKGEIVGLLGPNGAGKTTMFRCILGLLNFEGSILVDGRDTRKEGKWVRENIGYLPQHSAPYDDLSVEDNLKFYAGIKGVKPQRVVETLKDIKLVRFRDRKARALSGGMKQKVALLRTIAFNSSILLLDEPFGSLDAITRSSLHLYLLDIWKKLGLTIIFTTHDIREAIFLSDRIYVLSKKPARITDCIKVNLPRPRK